MRAGGIVGIVSLALAGSSIVAPAGAEIQAHCAYRLEPVELRHRGELVRARPVRLGCFTSFAEALSAGSGGAIAAPAGTKPSTLTQALLRGHTLGPRRGQVLIGTEYNEGGFQGSSNSYFAANTCQGQTWEIGYVTDQWNDKFESGKGFGGCDSNKKFAASQFGGSSITCTPNCSDYGTLSNEVSSLRWRP